MECNFHVGQKVVCVDDDKTPPAGHVVISNMIYPVKGQIYTVRKVMLGAIGRLPCIALFEIPEQAVEVLVRGEIKVGDVLYNAAAFRPLTSRKTDISIFKAMLTPKNEQVSA